MRQGLNVLFAIGFAALAGCDPGQGSAAETNKALIHRFTEAVNEAQWDDLGDLVSANFVRHSQATEGPEVRSLDEFIALQQSFLAGMPDQHVTLEMLVAEDDLVATLGTYSGTLTGQLGEFRSTGKFAESTFLSIIRVENGRIAEMWVEWDNVAMLDQLGLFPPPTPPES